ncbi:MAG: thioredoxin-dependent thiol peroxidase [Spirochaetota bacterium]|nr:thioredoxin-dependent thiol peroxidase [Spirochaetota bacterium]
MLKKGDSAPQFSLDSLSGNKISLSDYVGKWVIVYFYPKDSTPGCILQAINFSCLYPEFQALGVDIIGINGDSIESHQKFTTKNKLEVILLSDTEKSTLSAYKVWGEKIFMGTVYAGLTRSTFIINPEGIIEEAMYNVKAKDHGTRVLRILKQLLGAK